MTSVQPSRDDWVGGITPDEDPDAEKESDLSYGELCDYYGGKWKKFDRKDSWYDGDCQFKGKEARADYKDALCDYHSKDIPEICMGEEEDEDSRDDWVGGITPDEDPDAEKESDLSYGELCDYYGGKWKKFDRKDSWYDGDCQFKGKEARADYKDALCDYHSKDIPEICMGEKKKMMMIK